MALTGFPSVYHKNGLFDPAEGKTDLMFYRRKGNDASVGSPKACALGNASWKMILSNLTYSLTVLNPLIRLIYFTPRTFNVTRGHPLMLCKPLVRLNSSTFFFSLVSLATGTLYLTILSQLAPSHPSRHALNPFKFLTNLPFHPQTKFTSPGFMHHWPPCLAQILFD